MTANPANALPSSYPPPGPEEIPSHLLPRAAAEMLPDSLAPSLREGIAAAFVETLLPDLGPLKTPSALDREREIKERLARQDEHDARRMAESRPSPEAEPEVLLNAERVAQSIHLQEMGVRGVNPPPPHKDGVLTDRQAEQVDGAKALLKQKQGEIEWLRQKELAETPEELHAGVEARADLRVVEAIAGYQKAVSAAGVSPVTADEQLAATWAAREAAENAEKEPSGNPIGAYLAAAKVPEAPGG